MSGRVAGKAGKPLPTPAQGEQDVKGAASGQAGAGLVAPWLQAAKAPPPPIGSLASAQPALRLHGLPPVVGPNTRVLILGSFPSVLSLQAGRYYAHPQNQFWRLLQSTLAVDEGSGNALDVMALDGDARMQQLLRWGLGVWDVYASCERSGSLDSAIRAPELNDFVALAQRLPHLQGLAFNGAESWKHQRRVAQVLDVPMWRLPSSSAANASWSLARKAQAWRSVFAQAGLRVRAC